MPLPPGLVADPALPVVPDPAPNPPAPPACAMIAVADASRSRMTNAKGIHTFFADIQTSLLCLFPPLSRLQMLPARRFQHLFGDMFLLSLCAGHAKRVGSIEPRKR